VGELLGAGRIRAMLEERGVRPRKELGQNFVVDPNTIRKVISVAGLTGTERVLEVGAGAGSLTVGLADAADQVVAVEFDRSLLPILGETTGGLENVEIVAGDALRINLASYDADVVVSNLPYNIAVPLVIKILEEAPGIRTLTVMTQREIGERLVAAPLSKAFGQVSVIVTYFGSAEIEARISRRAFYPVPQVDSVLVRIFRTREGLGDDYPALARLVKAGFSQRRKTLRNSLQETLGGRAAAEAILTRAGIDPSRRAESVAYGEWLSLAEATE
jgi:16S rRNA (adenine1518-N6/adenine1519-N6)-dimethyltransferase